MSDDALLNEWEKLLEKTSNVYIYGAGKIGKKIISLFERYNFKEKISGVVVSDKSGISDEFESLPVIQIDKLDISCATVFVAVSDQYQEEILRILEKKRVNNVVNAYKYACLAEAMPGNVEVIFLEKLLQNQIDNHSITRLDIMLRLKTIHNYYAGKKDAFDEYIQMQDFRTQKGYGTIAEARFKKLLESYEKNGYDQNTEIQVDRNYHLIDGSHRISLALYHKKMFIKVRKFDKVFDCDYGKKWFDNHFSETFSTELEKMYLNEIKRLDSEPYSTERLIERLTLMLGSTQAFGRGEFYQSFPKLDISGQRPTDVRIKAYGLINLVKGKNILDIGCNCGFLDMSLSEYAASVTGIEYNKSLVDIAKCTSQYLNIQNILFEQGDFNVYIPKIKYDVIFSFAVHYWIGMSPVNYAEKLCSMLTDCGLIVFESQDVQKDSGFDAFLMAFASKGLKPIKSGTICDDGIITRKWDVLKKA